jgi:molybdenum cofactor guanylyltransferase
MAEPAPDVDGVVLAGGASRRFGTDKAFAQHEGQSLLQHAAQTLKPLVRTTWVLGRQGEDLQRYQSQAPGARILLDASPAGPVAALAGLLAQDVAPWLIVIPVDAPALTTHDIDVMLRLAQARKEIVHARLAEGARYDLFAASTRSLRIRLPAADRLRDLVEPGLGMLLPPRVGWNINTPQDLGGSKEDA